METLPVDVLETIARGLRDAVYADDVRLPTLPVFLRLNHFLRRLCQRVLKEDGYCDVLCHGLRYTLMPCAETFDRTHLPFEWHVWTRVGLFQNACIGRVPHCSKLWFFRPYHVFASSSVQDFQEALFFVDTGFADLRDVEDIVQFMGLGKDLEDFAMKNIAPMDRLLIALCTQEVRWRRASYRRGARRLGLSVG